MKLLQTNFPPTNPRLILSGFFSLSPFENGRPCDIPHLITSRPFLSVWAPVSAPQNAYSSHTKLEAMS